MTAAGRICRIDDFPTFDLFVSAKTGCWRLYVVQSRESDLFYRSKSKGRNRSFDLFNSTYFEEKTFFIVEPFSVYIHSIFK